MTVLCPNIVSILFTNEDVEQTDRIANELNTARSSLIRGTWRSLVAINGKTAS